MHQGQLVGRGLLIGAVMAAAVTVTTQADEDWRKLRDFKGPVFSEPIVGRKLSDKEAQTVGGFPASNVSLLAHLPLNMFGSPANANDCWGYVSPSGREYAIMGSRTGTHFIEVTDPVNPVIIGFIDGADSLWRDIKVRGQYAYSVNESGNGVQVINLSQIDSGIVTLVRNAQPNGLSTNHNISINPDTPYLYLSGSNLGNGSIVVLDITDPENPTYAGRWQEASAFYAHDCQVISYTEGPYAGREIAFCFDAQVGLDIVDVTNKANIFRVSRLTYSNTNYGHQGWVSEDRRYVYIDDELDEMDDPDVTTTTTRIVNIENLSSPQEVGTFTTGLPTIDHNQYIRDGLIYQANYTSGLRVFAAIDPLAPIEIAYFDTRPENNATTFNGAWSVFPFFPSGTVIVSDIERGLFVLEVNANFVDITFDTQPPSQLIPGESQPVSVSITTVGSALNESSVTLHVGVNGGAYTQVPMTSLGDGAFVGNIPPADCFDDVSFYISASNTLGDTYTNPADAPADAYHAIVATGESVLADLDMEVGTGWVVGAAGDNATSGIWNRMDPEATSAQPEDDHTPTGTQCWVTDGRAGGSDGAFDVDNGRTTLVSPVFDLSNDPDANLSYWRWYSNHAGGAPGADTFVIDITNNGTTWVNVETVGPSGEGTTGGWFYHEFRVADFVTPTATVRLRFVAADLNNASLVEAAIDDLRIVTLVCDEPSCPADWDDNGIVNPNDVGAFLTDYFQDIINGTLTTDVDGNGVVNPADVGAFLTLYFEPCGG